jgi:hypothetical protein
LWTVSLLTAFAVILGYQVRQKLTLAWRLEERERLSAIASSAARRVIVLVKGGSLQEPAGWFGSPWSRNDELFAGQEIAGVPYSVGYEYRTRDEQEASGFWYGLMDEDRKINLNTAELGVLQRLIGEALSVDDAEALEYAASIVDWRDEDAVTATPSAGAENSYYQTLVRPYEAKNAPFELPEELLLVKGITPSVYDVLKVYVTVYGKGQVNINTAPKTVLIGLGLQDDLAANIVELRTGRDGQPGTEDDHIFEAPSSVVAQLADAYALTADEINQLNQVLGSVLVCNSGTFSFTCRARPRGGRVESSVACVVDSQGAVLSWRQT